MAKFDVPESLAQDSLKVLEIARNTGKISRGTNEVTKAIERGKAILVYIAEDVQPPEIVAHLPLLCDEKKIPYIFVKTRADIGKACGIDVQAASVTISDAGKAAKRVSEIAEKLKGIRGGKAQKEKPAEATRGKPRGPESPGKKAEEKPKAEAKPEKREEKPAEKRPDEKPNADAPKPERKEEKPKAEAPKGEKKAEEKPKAEKN